MERENIPEAIRDVNFWLSELKKSGILKIFPGIDNVITGKNKFFQNTKPVMENVSLGGKIMDIYDVGGGCLYLQIKE